MSGSIIIKGAREYNFENLDVEIPRDKLVVITGLSRSGKSSLAWLSPHLPHRDYRRGILSWGL